MLGKTGPSFALELAIEKEKWKPFSNALNKSGRRNYDKEIILLF